MVLSLFDKFFRATTRVESVISLKSGGSVTYERGDNDDEDKPWPAAKPPRPPYPGLREGKAPEMARLLEAWDLNCLLLMLTGRQERLYLRGRGQTLELVGVL